jgi:hypothetical protein
MGLRPIVMLNVERVLMSHRLQISYYLLLRILQGDTGQDQTPARMAGRSFTLTK